MKMNIMHVIQVRNLTLFNTNELFVSVAGQDLVNCVKCCSIGMISAIRVTTTSNLVSIQFILQAHYFTENFRCIDGLQTEN